MSGKDDLIESLVTEKRGLLTDLRDKHAQIENLVTENERFESELNAARRLVDDLTSRNEELDAEVVRLRTCAAETDQGSTYTTAELLDANQELVQQLAMMQADRDALHDELRQWQQATLATAHALAKSVNL